MSSPIQNQPFHDILFIVKKKKGGKKEKERLISHSNTWPTTSVSNKKKISSSFFLNKTVAALDLPQVWKEPNMRQSLELSGKGHRQDRVTDYYWTTSLKFVLSNVELLSLQSEETLLL